MFKLLKAGVAAVSVLAMAATAQAQTLTAETPQASSAMTLAVQVMATYGGMDLQVNTGQTLTRSCLKLGNGEIDSAVCAAAIYNLMNRGVGPYASDPEGAAASAANLRSLFGFAGGMIHAIVPADSDIETWDDLAGRRIFTGPPAGAANTQVQTVIRAATGFEPDVDYEAVHVDWSGAMQAFQDGQFDAFFYPTSMGDAALEQLAPMRLLSLTDDILTGPGWQAWLNIGGTGEGTIPVGTYSNLANENDVRAPQTFFIYTVNVAMDEDTAYTLTRAFWENLPAAQRDLVLLRPIDPSEPAAGDTIPLHPGALRYYDEIGATVPDALR